MLQDIGWFLLYPTTPSVFPTNQVGIIDADALSRIQWPEAVDISSQTVHAVFEGVQAPHVKIETLCHGAQAVGVLSQDKMPSGMIHLSESSPNTRPCNLPSNSGYTKQNFGHTHN